VKPVEISIGLTDASASKRLRVKVVNADPINQPGHIVRLVASDGTCPPGIIIGLPDFDRRTAGAQDSVFLAPGKQGVATVNVTALSISFTPFNNRAPQRCRINLTAQSMVVGNADPEPSNNALPLEVSVTDANDPQQTTMHESYLRSVKAATVKLARGRSSLVKRVPVAAGNGDLMDVAGHGVTVSLANGGCPLGTAGATDFDGGTAGAQSTASVPAGLERQGKSDVNVAAAAYHSRSLKSPVRCIAILTGSGPAGDTDASNNVTWLVVDVVDRNDL
jgi:hypothetical protein